MNDDTIKIIEDIYRILFVMNNSVSNGIKQIENEIIDSEYKTMVIDFIKNSENGIIKGLI